MIAPEVAPDEVVLESAPEADSPPAVVWSPPQPATLRPSAPPLPAAAPVQPVATPSAEPIPTPPAADRPVSASVEPVPATRPGHGTPRAGSDPARHPGAAAGPGRCRRTGGRPGRPPPPPRRPALPPPRHHPLPRLGRGRAALAARARSSPPAPPRSTPSRCASPSARSNIRYYHAADRDGAGRVAEAVAGAPPTGRRRPATSPTTRRRRCPARVEIWIAGTPPPPPRRGAPTRRRRRADAADAAPVPPPPAARQAEAVARIIVERSLERLPRIAVARPARPPPAA